ncbi:MAG: FtsX-like permease family protein [Microbacteriaceae bacterium]
MRARTFMRPLQWWALSVQRGFSSSVAVVVLCAVCTALLAALLVPIITVAESVSAQRTGSGVLTQIDVSAGDGESGSAPALTTDSRALIAALPGVRDVTADISVGIYAGAEGVWSTTIRTVNPANVPPGADAAIATSLTGNEVIVPSEIDSIDLAALIGGELPIEYTQASGENEGELRQLALRPVAAYDPTWQGYGPNAVLAGETQVATLLAARFNLDVESYLSTHGVSAVIVTVNSEEQVNAVASALRDRGYDARPQRDSLGELPGIVSVFPLVFTAGAVAVMALLGGLVLAVVRNAVTRRSSEFGLLRIRGWSIRDVRRLIVLDVGAGSLIGSVLGVGVGTGLGWVITSSMATSGSGIPAPAMPVTTALVGALAGLGAAPVALAVCVGLIASHRALRRDPYLTLVRSG